MKQRRHSRSSSLNRQRGSFFERAACLRPTGSPLFFQPKLRVGSPGDRFEREADRVADQVVSTGTAPAVQRMCAECSEGGGHEREIRRQPEMEEEVEVQASEDGQLSMRALTSDQQPEEEEETAQAKREAGAPSRPPASTEATVRGLASGGEPLPPAVRTFFAPRFGHDFNSVRIHRDTSAAEAAADLGARAFTVGSSIAFGRGQYTPSSHEGRRLLAHELTHVLQQEGGGSTVRRKILLGGKSYNPKSDYGWIEKSYGAAGVEILKRMYNDGKAPDFKFNAFGDMHREVKLRTQAIRGMEAVHAGCCSYPTGGGTGKLDSTYWDKVGPYKFTMKSPLPAGKEPADAIESIFKSGAGTELECNSTLVAIQYRAMLKTLGKTRFNTKFAGGAGVIISPHHQPPAGVSRHPIWTKKLYKRVTISGAADLLPGDWVYFKNINDYSSKHPGGFWTGEHALYMGGGKFRGFGVTALSETDINKELLKAYNTGLAAADQKVLADVPGLRDYARRPVIDEILKP